ncbi:uncharacterized protein LOC130099786 [Rhinichthys klamathensis goyatoka]|uniref:uncharacterized protein LOC130099786 n=1 Tax=Rhinichthys klamathensis goyatoka TaxID=3034132 RepID=UPI0024B4FF1A|nr:uncharacterized protein LOC130099786 [Rhinichthys klamathensis goyatoka]
MSDPEMDRLLNEMSDLVDQAEHQAHLKQLISMHQEAEPSTSNPSTSRSSNSKQDVRWIKRDSDGNIIYGRPRSSRKQAESFLQELKSSLGEDIHEDETALQASTDWSTRKSLISGWWEKERPRLVNTLVARQHAATRICQHCGNGPAVIRCSDCRPHPFLCGQCDVRVHRGQVFHNRDSMTHAFFHPLPPTTCVVERVLTQCERLVPLEMPETICGCLRVSSSVIAGQSIVVVTMNGRYDLRLPQIRCKACEATWSPGVDDLIRNDYWPATSHYSTVYATDVLFSFEELKMAAPGMSSQAFLRMLDQRTVRFGRSGNFTADSFRKSFLEWEAVRFEVDKLCQEDHFDCPACSPDMLAVSVDGNRKHYRFKSAARSEEIAIFDGVFIANDDDVARFVDYVHTSTSYVNLHNFTIFTYKTPRPTEDFV